MGRMNHWLPLLFLGSLISSCTCHKQVEDIAKAPTPAGHGTGFASSRPTLHAPAMAAPPTMPPTRPQADAASPTPVTEAGQLPPDFPTDVPMMEGFEVGDIHKLPADAKAVIIRAQQERKDIYEFYEKDLRAKGWVIEQNYQGKEQSFLGFKKGNTILNVTVTNDHKNPGKRIISMMYQEDHPPEFGDF